MSLLLVVGPCRAQLAFLAYLNFDGLELKIAQPMQDLFAKLVLPDDDKTLHKLFPKSEGPKKPNVANEKGAVLISLAETIAAYFWEKEAARKAQEQDPAAAATVQESLAQHDKDRRKRMAQHAVAKRASKRQARTMGSVVL